MIRKIRSSLSAKVFLMTAVLMAVCCSITYFCITQFAPYIYTHDFSTIDEELPYFVEDISRFTKEEALFVIEDYCNQIVEKMMMSLFSTFFKATTKNSSNLTIMIHHNGAD